ncbi:DUF4253 domain-containing protein, partial [Mycobacteroides abscessus]|nr:DUF4253 domain-containing protein [Mycobacteroides abscessus]
MVVALVLGLTYLFGQAYWSKRTVFGDPQPAH